MERKKLTKSQTFFCITCFKIDTLTEGLCVVCGDTSTQQTDEHCTSRTCPALIHQACKKTIDQEGEPFLLCPWCQFTPSSSDTDQPQLTKTIQEQPETTQAEQKPHTPHETPPQEHIQGPTEPTTPLHSDDSTTDSHASPKKPTTPPIKTTRLNTKRI